MDPDQDSLSHDLLQLTLLCRKVDRRIALAMDLSVDEVHCIIALHGRRSIRVKELYDILGLSPTRTSKVLRPLEERSLLRRTLHQEDRRIEEAALTDGGLLVAEKILSISTQLVKELFLPITRCGGPLFSYMSSVNN